MCHVLQAMSVSSGRPDASVTLTDATVPTFSPLAPTDGSGPDLEPRSDPRLNATLGTGARPVVSAKLNLTTEKLLRYEITIRFYIITRMTNLANTGNPYKDVVGNVIFV